MRFAGEAPVADGRVDADGIAIDGHRPVGRSEGRYDLLPATAAASMHGCAVGGRDPEHTIRNRRRNGITRQAIEKRRSMFRRLWQRTAAAEAEKLIRDFRISVFPVCPFSIAEEFGIEVRALLADSRSAYLECCSGSETSSEFYTRHRSTAMAFSALVLAMRLVTTAYRDTQNVSCRTAPMLHMPVSDRKTATNWKPITSPPPC